MARIWVVDDEASLRELLTEMLADDGHTVRTFATGMALLTALETEMPDVIVLDMMLPQMDGATIWQQLAGHPRWRQIPCVIMSALRRQELARLAPGVPTLPKPFTLDELLATVERLLAG